MKISLPASVQPILTSTRQSSRAYQASRRIVPAAVQQTRSQRTSPSPSCPTCQPHPSKPSLNRQYTTKSAALFAPTTSSQSSHKIETPFASPPPSKPRTHYELFPQTFPDGPPPTGHFKVDLRALRNEFLRLQATAHPDLHPQHRKSRAEAASSAINEAYKTLQNPLLRAQYLLRLQSVDMEDESSKLAADPRHVNGGVGVGAGGGDMELLMEVMEAREAIDEAREEDDLVELRTENEERITRSEEVLEHAFRDGDLSRAAREAVRLRYWVNIRDSLHGWEKGKGGGDLHH